MAKKRVCEHCGKDFFEWDEGHGPRNICSVCGQLNLNEVKIEYEPPKRKRLPTHPVNSKAFNVITGKKADVPILYDENGQEESISDSLETHGIDTQGCCAFSAGAMYLALSRDGRKQALGLLLFQSLGILSFVHRRIVPIFPRMWINRLVGSRRHIGRAIRKETNR